MTKEANLEAVNGALSKEVRKLQEELKAADKRNFRLTARVEELEGVLDDIVQWADCHGKDPDWLEAARAALTKGESNDR